MVSIFYRDSEFACLSDANFLYRYCQHALIGRNRFSADLAVTV